MKRFLYYYIIAPQLQGFFEYNKLAIKMKREKSMVHFSEKNGVSLSVCVLAFYYDVKFWKSGVVLRQCKNVL